MHNTTNFHRSHNYSHYPHHHHHHHSNWGHRHYVIHSRPIVYHRPTPVFCFCPSDSSHHDGASRNDSNSAVAFIVASIFVALAIVALIVLFNLSDFFIW